MAVTERQLGNAPDMTGEFGNAHTGNLLIRATGLGNLHQSHANCETATLFGQVIIALPLFFRPAGGELTFRDPEIQHE